MQQRALAKLAAHSSSKSFQDCMEEGIKYQAQLRKRNKIDSKDFEYAKRVRRPRASAPDAAPDEEGLADAPETRESSLEPSASEASGAAGVEAGAVGGGGGGGNEVELILRPHSDLSGDDECPAPLKTTRFLKTTDNATVEHIANYVAIRVKLDTEESARLAESTGSALVTAPQWAADTFRVFINPGIGSNKPFTLLDHNLTLAEVRSRYWKVKRPLELQFKLGDEAPAAAPPASTVPPPSALPPPHSSLSLSTAHPNGQAHNPPLSSPLQNSLFGSSGNS